MPGIFLGATPVDVGRSVPIQEVYVGAVKVWPTTVALLYGSQWAVYRNSAISESSQVGITSVAPQGLGFGTIDWGFSLPSWGGGQVGTVPSTDASGNTRGRFSRVDNTITELSGVTTVGGNGTTPSNTFALTRAFTSPENNRLSGRDAYARFAADGTLLWASEPGFSASVSATGVYQVTCPGPLEGSAAFGALVRDSTTTVNQAGQVLSNVNPAAGTFTFRTYVASTLTATGFSVWVSLA